MWRGHEYEHNQFGDHGYEASCRRDFLGGLFYSGRREYLHENEKSNSLEPPNEFKTKKQENLENFKLGFGAQIINGVHFNWVLKPFHYYLYQKISQLFHLLRR